VENPSLIPFRPGMTATVYIITKNKEKCFVSAYKPVVIKAAYHSSKEVKMPEDLMKNGPKSDKKFGVRFVGWAVRLKYGSLNRDQDDANIEVKSGLKKEIVITGPYTTVAKDLNSETWFMRKQINQRNKVDARLGF
jgi:HlyD family secretion protein